MLQLRWWAFDWLQS